jgi:hypothetical protein
MYTPVQYAVGIEKSNQMGMNFLTFQFNPHTFTKHKMPFPMEIVVKHALHVRNI